MNRISGLAGVAGLFVAGIAAAAAPGCQGSTPGGYDLDGGGGGATATTATLTIAFAGTGSGSVQIVPDTGDAGTDDAGASCSAACTERYPTTTTVNLTTTAAGSSIFDGWTPDSCGTPLSMSANVTCTATFQELELPEGGDDGGGG